MLFLKIISGRLSSLLILIISCSTISLGQMIVPVDTTRSKTTGDSDLYYKIARRIPKPISYVNDFEGIFTMAVKQRLDSMIVRFERESTIEMAVVTLDSTITDKANFDETTLIIARKWGVGKKGKNNGILIGFSRGLRMIRIQNGYGIVEKLSDRKTKEIIDNIILPQFKKDDYFEGIRQGIFCLYQQVK